MTVKEEAFQTEIKKLEEKLASCRSWSEEESKIISEIFKLETQRRRAALPKRKMSEAEAIGEFFLIFQKEVGDHLSDYGFNDFLKMKEAAFEGLSIIGGQ